jgi:hypothetical protein
VRLKSRIEGMLPRAVVFGPPIMGIFCGGESVASIGSFGGLLGCPPANVMPKSYLHLHPYKHCPCHLLSHSGHEDGRDSNLASAVGHERNAPLVRLSGCCSWNEATFADASRSGGRAMAVGNRVTPVPPPRTGRAAFPHPAPTSDSDGKTLRPSVRAPASVTRFPGSVSGACVAGSRSPRPPPFAPSPPLPVPRFCSATSPLL